MIQVCKQVMAFVNLESGIFEITQVNSKCHRLLSTRAPQSVDFEAASGGDEDNAAWELEYPGVIRLIEGYFVMGLCIGCKKLGLTKDKFMEIVPLPDHFDAVVWGIFEKIIQAPD
ncbi:hypothetical protein SADUNF_Sadunf17G0055300 [Salix dunnii]|uniref:Uncharacterized protein n=1 Tax=Salix dunnii TaxID=1413687 RepID=A0A835MH58_9ROSI|nr:hypothetical protein SADUNF_Sadunf17G0055300 [Salix dunnii]